MSDGYFCEHSRALRRLATSFCPVCGRLAWISGGKVYMQVDLFSQYFKVCTLTFVVGFCCPLQCLESEGCDYVCLPSNVLCTIDCLRTQCCDQLSPIDHGQPLHVANKNNDLIHILHIGIIMFLTFQYCSFKEAVLQNPFIQQSIRIYTCISVGYFCIPPLLSGLLAGVHELSEPVVVL